MSDLTNLRELRGHQYGVLHQISAVSGTLSEVLEECHLKSPFTAQDLIRFGAVYVNQKRIMDENFLVKKDDYLRIHQTPRRFPVSITSANSWWGNSVVAQTEDFLIINKPAGLPCHSSVDNFHENLHSVLQNISSQKLYVTHRLDVPTQGLILYAKTSEFQTIFNKNLASNEVIKIYEAQVQGCFPTELETLVHYMEPNPRAPKKLSAEPMTGWQICKLKVLKASYNKDTDRSILEIQLLTGRTHQIRSQLAFLGYPICGDHLYGAKENRDSIDLICKRLSFPYKEINGNPSIFETEIPSFFK